MQSFTRKLQRACELGLPVVLAEIRRRLTHLVTRYVRRFRAVWSPPTLSLKQLEDTLPNLPRVRWLEYFQTRSTPHIFPGLTNPKQTAETIRATCPKAVTTTISSADALCEHRFYYFGHEFVHPSDNIDWCSGWPKKHYTQIVYGAQLVPPKDIKLTWEIGRFWHANTLGRAYALTGEERYAREFFTQLESFDQTNPCEFGPHWLCAMEVALRAINLSVSFYFFRHSTECTAERMARLLRMLYEHGRFIEQNLENAHHVTSNHYLSDLAGLLFIGILFPEFATAQRWHEFAWNELLAEFKKQVYPDGADWEASIGYHRLVTELFFYAFWLGENNGLKFPVNLKPKLSQMFDFVRAYLRPDGCAPQIGDTDNGQVLTWAERRPTDHAYLLPLGHGLGRQGSGFRVQSSEIQTKKTGDSSSPETMAEAVWFFGSVPPETTEGAQSTAFPDAGIYVMRDGGEYLIVDCGDNGIHGQGSHGHNDALSFELWAGGRAWLVDPGTYTYTGDLAARDLFRSTEYHNTARVDGQEINPILPKTPFALGSNVQPRVLLWKSNSEEDVLEAEHDGFMRLPDPVKHQRKIVFDKKEHEWIIEDRFLGNPSSENHAIELFFNFDSGVKLEKISHHELHASDADHRQFFIQLIHSSTPLTVEELERWVSQGYGHRTRSQGVKWQTEGRLPMVLTWRMFAVSPDSSPQTDFFPITNGKSH